MLKRFAVAAVTLLSLVCAGTARAEFTWIEGEKPESANVAADAGVYRPGPMAQPALQSGRALLSIALSHNDAKEKLPADGLTVRYEFHVEGAGRRAVWARIGYEWARSAFDWRLDDGEWQTLGSDVPTVDIVELSAWNELAWIRLVETRMAAGRHTIEFRHRPAFSVDSKGNSKPARTLHMLDAVCVTDEPFRPNGRFKPGEDWRTDEDRKAAAKVYELPAAPAGTRSHVELTGLWEIARWDEYDVPRETQFTGVTALPADYDDLFWVGVQTPGDRNIVRPDMKFCHRLIYRARVNVPAEFEGRGFVLEFQQFNMIASVFVNGRFVEWSKLHDTVWQCDISEAVQAGAQNEIAVVLKDIYYAVNQERNASVRDSGIGLRRIYNTPIDLFKTSAVGPSVDFPVSAPHGDGGRSGLLEPVTLMAVGRTWVEDVFARPSVTDSKLDLEISLKNAGSAPADVEVRNSVVEWNEDGTWRSADPRKVFEPVRVTVPAGGLHSFDVSAAWADPKLWWPDDPNLYVVRTELYVDGHVIDTKWTRFGFREWGWRDGVVFTINGKPWQFWCDSDPLARRSPHAYVAEAATSGRNMIRIWGMRGWGGMTRREMLNYFDETGMVVRDTGAFDGEVFNYARGLTWNEDGSPGYNRVLMGNVLDQQKAWVRGSRNHACILIWTMENEVAFVSSANAGQNPEYLPAIRYVGGELQKLDPTRPVMIDGGNALTDPATWRGEGPWVAPAKELGYLPVNGCHYTERGYGVGWMDYPDAAYTAEHWYTHTDPRGGWTMQRDMPIFHGEIFYGRGNSVDALAELGGEQVYLGDEGTFPVRGLVCRMLSEGYRFNGVSSAWDLYNDNSDRSHHKA